MKKYLFGGIAVAVVALSICLYCIVKKEEAIDLDDVKETVDIKSVNYEALPNSTIELTESVKITEGGAYTLTGTLEGMIVVDTEDDVELILDGVSITNNGPCILVLNSNSTTIYLKEGTTSTLTDNSYDTTEYNATIYSKDDLIFDGSGTLVINANTEDAIASTDSLKIINGNFEITSTDDAIRGNDSVYIVNGTFDITANSGIKTSTDDTTKGNILIENGTFSINTTGDCLHADKDLSIKDGKFELTSKDDGIHATGLVEINGGTFTINSVEGIEGTYIKINDGDITINASDDGINAANKSTEYSVKVEINGGSITIKMGSGDTDGIDSNGDIIINGGTINVTGQSTFDYDGTGTINGGTVICNGEQVTTLPNQLMGGAGMGGMSGQMPNGMPGDMNEMPINGTNRGGGNRVRQ